MIDVKTTQQFILFQLLLEERRRRHEVSKACKERNKEHYLAVVRKWHQDNKQYMNDYLKDYEPKRKAKLKALGIPSYYERNKEKYKIYGKVNRERNIQNLRNRLKDPLYAFKSRLRNCVSGSFRRIGLNKPTNTLKLLGCTWQEAKEHIEKQFVEGMTWDNRCSVWQIDHIRPVCSFTIEDVHLMNHITNLRPLFIKDNREKSGRDRKLSVKLQPELSSSPPQSGARLEALDQP